MWNIFLKIYLSWYITWSIWCGSVWTKSPWYFLKYFIKHEPLFGRTPVVWCTPWNQYVLSNYKCDFSLLSSSEFVKLEYSFSVYSIMVFKSVKDTIQGGFAMPFFAWFNSNLFKEMRMVLVGTAKVWTFSECNFLILLYIYIYMCVCVCYSYI